MKKNLIFGLIIMLAVIAVSSCSLLGVGITMADRVGFFVLDLNGSRANIIDNIHPDAGSYNQIDDNYWTESPWTSTDAPFSIVITSEGSSSISGTFNSGTYTNATIVIEMKDDGDFFIGADWKIMSINIAGGTNEL